MTHGHASTTGVPTLQYYVSYKPFELPSAQTHYSEKLVTFSDFSYYYKVVCVYVCVRACACVRGRDAYMHLHTHKYVSFLVCDRHSCSMNPRVCRVILLTSFRCHLLGARSRRFPKIYQRASRWLKPWDCPRV